MLFWFENNCNNVGESTQKVFLVSSTSAGKHGLPILPLNFKESVALYVIRRINDSNYINREDVYLMGVSK